MRAMQVGQNGAGMAVMSVIGDWPKRIALNSLALAGVAVVIGNGMAMNWGSLVAAGLASILVSIAPGCDLRGPALCATGGFGVKCWNRLAEILK